jgi:hypothetical protein
MVATLDETSDVTATIGLLLLFGSPFSCFMVDAILGVDDIKTLFGLRHGDRCENEFISNFRASPCRTSPSDSGLYHAGRGLVRRLRRCIFLALVLRQRRDW